MILKLVDAHAHFDSLELESLPLDLDQSSISVISNSVNVESSVRNLELAKKFASIVPFVGIHPEIFRPSRNDFSKVDLDGMVEKVATLLKFAKGIGEIGLDPSYGRVDNQRYLFSKILETAEKTRHPVTLHSRDAIAVVLEILSTYNLKSRILFHWFAGAESELKRVHDAGMYTSFGPSIIFSKRIGTLLQLSDRRYILAETDSPTRFRSLLDSPSNPTLVSSVVFQMGLLLNLPFDQTCELTNTNAENYLTTQD